MALKRIVDGAYLLPMGNANAVLLEDGPDLVMIDAGFAKKEALAFDAIRALGRSPRDLKHLIFTHGHPDHIGSAAAILRESGATTYMHPTDAPLAEGGGPFRPMTPAPGLLHKAMFRLVWDQNERLEPFRIDRPLADGDVVPLAGGLRIIGVPGHCAGQVALIWQDRLLIAGDVFMNIFGLADPIGFEDAAEGRRSQRKLAALAVDAACFGHGKAIASGAAEKLRRAARG